jgi:hypothetical protein
MSLLLRLAVGAGVVILVAGCGILPEISHQPTYHNPFPQLTKVAVAPFFNLSAEPTVDGRQFADAYFNALQAIPGFEVVPFTVVEAKANEMHLSLANPIEVRKLAEALEVDAVVIGAVTDFSPYYPPRCALQVEWYAANPCFHTVPAGYGLPWGTIEEEYIPDTLVLESELELARSQLKTQTPTPISAAGDAVPASERKPAKTGNLLTTIAARREAHMSSAAKAQAAARPSNAAMPSLTPPPAIARSNEGKQMAYLETVDGDSAIPTIGMQSVLSPRARASAAAKKQPPEVVPGPLPDHGPIGPAPLVAPPAPGALAAVPIAQLPVDWPDPRGLVPAPPSPVCPDCRPSDEPVLRHTRVYNGHDVGVTTALETYRYFKDDARTGGWQSYLQRSDDFIRFCCHMHITEMLSARGGAGETRVVWRWPERR